jgi:tRNA dimethylallyltransferase
MAGSEPVATAVAEVATLGPLPATCHYLTGPTASGKSGLALEVAEELGAEIVALDSMTLFRGMDIGTAKATAADRARVPHHLIDVLDPDQASSLDCYIRRALECVHDIEARGRRALLVGGTPLYLKACLRGMFAGPPADPELRAALEQRAELAGTPALHAELAAVDPVAAGRIERTDTRRVVRALEVYRATGRPISDFQRQFAAPAEPPPKVACLAWPRETLYRRIDRRVIEMLDAGWVDEVRRLRGRYPHASREARQAVGYREIAEHLDGRLPWSEMVTLIQTRTRQFSKRQRTWFRGLREVRPFAVEHDPAEVQGRLLSFFRGDGGDA